MLAQRLDLSLSETIDVLSDLGMQAPIEYEDYRKDCPSSKMPEPSYHI